jgi:hypothetical protein
MPKESSDLCVIVYKASAMPGEVSTSLQVKATEEFPELRDLTESRRRHWMDGQHLAKALLETLPGATIDQLLVALMEHRCSLLRAAHRPLPRPMIHRISGEE